MKKFLLFIIFLIVVILIAAQFLLPDLVSRQIEDTMGKKLNTSEATVRIEAKPAARILLGEVDHLSGNFENAQLGALTFSDVHVNLKSVQVNPFQLILTRQVEITSLGNGEIETLITNADLEALINKSVKGLNDARVNITEDGVELTGQVNVGGFLKGAASVSGTLVIKDNQLVFAPNRFAIQGINVSGLNSSLLKDVPIYDFGNFPITAEAERVILKTGEVHIIVRPIAK